MGEICDKCEIKHILSHIFMFFWGKSSPILKKILTFFHHNKFVCVGVGSSQVEFCVCISQSFNIKSSPSGLEN
jgi:hypothetical protein